MSKHVASYLSVASDSRRVCKRYHVALSGREKRNVTLVVTMSANIKSRQRGEERRIRSRLSGVRKRSVDLNEHGKVPSRDSNKNAHDIM